jgi:hypothetical protein
MAHAFQLFYFYGLLLQITAIVHFIRRRPDTYWLWIILFGGALGSAIYLLVEAVPDLKLLGVSFKLFHNRKRIHQLEWLVKENPAPANYEELGTLYSQQKRWAGARDCFSKAIASRPDSLDPFYHRAIASMALSDYSAAAADLERVVLAQANFDFYRAATSLANCYARMGDIAKAGALLEQVTRCSTLTEAQLQYALFLADQGRETEALEWVERILAKRPTMPRFQRRNESPLFRQARGLRKKLRAAGSVRHAPAGSNV